VAGFFTFLETSGRRCYWHLRQRHTDFEFGEVWIGTSIREVLETEVSVTLWAREALFLQDNARSHVAGDVQNKFEIDNVRCLPWSARSPDLFPVVHVGCRRRIVDYDVAFCFI
jgi:hypothetical protein